MNQRIVYGGRRPFYGGGFFGGPFIGGVLGGLAGAAILRPRPYYYPYYPPYGYGGYPGYYPYY
ncbi:hypothetical protein HF072_06875 [Bacillus sp. RO3]|nr:hypothetical protein [Bacillus sp. RO3]